MKLRRCAAIAALLATAWIARATEASVASPDGKVRVIVDDADGLQYRVTLDGEPALAKSRLGLDFAGGFSLGRHARIEGSSDVAHDETLDNPFGQRRAVRDHFRELTVTANEHADAPSQFKLLVRATTTAWPCVTSCRCNPGSNTTSSPASVRSLRSRRT